MSLPHRMRARHRFWPVLLVLALLGFAPSRGAAARPVAKATPAAAADEATPAVAPAEVSALRQQLEALKASRAELEAQRQKWMTASPEHKAGQLELLRQSPTHHRRMLKEAVLALSAEVPPTGSAEERNALLV